MNETLEQRLSMLLDGETTPFETKRLVDEIHCNPHIKALWLRMNKQRAALKGELIDPALDISSSVMSHLNLKQFDKFVCNLSKIFKKQYKKNSLLTF